MQQFQNSEMRNCLLSYKVADKKLMKISTLRIFLSPHNTINSNSKDGTARGISALCSVYYHPLNVTKSW